jgi:hypothetical protein
VPRHIAWLIACRLLLRLLHATECLGTSRASSRGSSRRSSLTTSPPPCVRVPQHVARLVVSLVVDYSTLRRLVIDYSASLRLVVDNSASRRLVIDYFASAARPGASARRAPRHAARQAARRRYSAWHRLVVDYSASRRLVVDYFASAARPGASARHAARHAARAPLVVDYSTSHRLVVDYSASRRLVVDNSASRRLVIEYFASATRPGASARRAADHVDRRVARRRLLRLTQANRRLLRLRRATGASASRAPRHTARRAARRRLLRVTKARCRQLRVRRTSGCLGTSRGSSSTTPTRAVSSWTTSPTPRVQLTQHVARLITRITARLVVDYFAYATRPGDSARRAAHHADRRATRRRLLRLRRVSWCLGTSRGSSLVVDYFTYST